MHIRRTALVGMATFGLIIGACPGTAFAAVPTPAHAISVSNGTGGNGGNGGNANVNCGSPVAIQIGPGAGTVTQCTATGGTGGTGGSGGAAGTSGTPGTVTCNGMMALFPTIFHCKVGS
jgi:hypothetical protein